MASHWGRSLIDEAEATESKLINYDNFEVDIVLVHGLNGDPRNTWTSRESGVFWPRDLLSKILPRARILTYGYNANVNVFDRTAPFNISSIAEGLLEFVEEDHDYTLKVDFPLLNGSSSILITSSSDRSQSNLCCTQFGWDRCEASTSSRF